MQIRVLAPAKVNLYLGVGGIRPDGYHEVTTVMQTLDLADEVTLTPAPVLELTTITDLSIPARENLAFRAATDFARAHHREPGVRIDLVKAIPHGAGLGGGSSDAAAVIRGLAALWDVPSDDARAREVAAGLGADVPFFLVGGTAMLVGRGDVQESIFATPPLAGVVVLPSGRVPTADAYRAFDASPLPTPDPTDLCDALRAGDSAAVAPLLANNLEGAARGVSPDVGDVLAWCRTQGGIDGVCVAGSGSAVFAVSGESRRFELVTAAREHGWVAWAVSFTPAGWGVPVVLA